MRPVVAYRRGTGSRALLTRALILAATHLTAGAQQADAPPSTSPANADSEAQFDVRRLAGCATLAAAPWPNGLLERRSLLQRLESVREGCMDHAGFLAALGGYWLEEGDAARAVLWLERSLMLDPTQQGARADYALALAAMGETAARDELLREWQGRSDVPTLLLSRLQEAAVQLAAADSPGRRWAHFREVSILLGHESNLDHSPRLEELTITPPGGPITLPLDTPLAPKPGTAALAELSWQTAFSPKPGSILQAGAEASARSSPGQGETDWHNLQLATSASQRRGSWRYEALASVTWIGGRLNEPYRLVRWGAAVESTGFGCTHRFSLDSEARSQKITTLANSHATSGSWSTTCPVDHPVGWSLGLAVKATSDRPDDEARAGGVQKQWSAGLRATGPLGSAGRLDATLRVTRALDEEGYSTLLDNDVRRWLRPLQLSVEYSHSLELPVRTGADLVAQLQIVRQDSNLPVFKYSSTGVFGGLRWRW